MSAHAFDDGGNLLMRDLAFDQGDLGVDLLLGA